MTTTSKNPVQEIAGWSLVLAYGWVAITLYLQCYWLFDRLHFTNVYSDRLLFHFARMGWLDAYMGRLIAVGILILAVGCRKDEKPASCSWARCLIVLSVGAAVYFGVAFFVLRLPDPVIGCVGCVVLTFCGLLILQDGIAAFVRLARPALSKEDPFGRMQGGFPQEERRIDTEFALHIRGEYEYKGEQQACMINILNPRRGTLILGSPGCGKSRFVIEPFLRQWMERGRALFLYDFKYDALTRLAYEYFGRYRNRYAASAEFYSLNFTDLSRSHRCNLLEPSTLQWLSDAIGVSRTILLSMNASWVDEQGEFFVESPINFLAAVIWLLKKYRDGQYCTLPHVIEMSLLPYEKLFTLLNAEPDIQALINPFIVAFRNKSFEMLDGQITSAKIPLARLVSPDVYYVLTGNDLNLAVNDPAAPKVVCLGGDPGRQEALGPVLSLYIDRVNTLCNQPERATMGIFCDEFASVRAYSMATLMATGRSNNIVPVIAVQDFNQLRTRYSLAEAETFLAISGNLFCGQLGGDTAERVAKRFPMIQRERSSESENANGGSITRTQHWEPTMTAATIATLSAGEFVGIVADDPGSELELKAFHARLKREQADEAGVKGKVPVVRKKAEKMAEEVFEQVRRDVQELVQRELAEIVRDPGRAGLVVK